MQNRFLKNQREDVRSKFGQHPLFLFCQYAFKQFEGRMPRLKFTPEEIFFETAVLIDRIMEDPGAFELYSPMLWDELYCEYLEFDRTVPEDELVLAVTCVYYATISSFALHHHAGYCYSIATDLFEDIHKHNANWKEFEDKANEMLHFHQDQLGEWINSYSDSESYLSDDIEEVLVKKDDGNPDSRKPFEPVRTTFAMTSLITTGNIALVCQELTNSGWIDKKTNPNDFQKLFSGNNSSVKIVWTGKVGIGALKTLFEQMNEKGFITFTSHSLPIILRSHFVTSKGKHIGDFRGASYTDKTASVIQTCLNWLEYQVN